MSLEPALTTTALDPLDRRAGNMQQTNRVTGYTILFFFSMTILFIRNIRPTDAPPLGTGDSTLGM